MGANQVFLDRYYARVVLCARTVLVCLLPGVIAGCGGSSGVGSPFEADENSIRIEVLNRNFADATLRAVVAGAGRRLGRVTGHTNRTFRLDWPYSAPLWVEIDLLAGQTCITREIFVQPGDLIELQIEPNLMGIGDSGCRLQRAR